MIQRIQTLYLLIAAGIILWASFKPVMTINESQVVIDGFKAAYSSGEKIFSTLPLNIILWLAAAISFITIFLFKNRILQMRLTNFTILILIGYYILIAYYRYKGITKFVDVEITKYTLFILFPLIGAILVYMANRAIKRDEELVRSTERFR